MKNLLFNFDDLKAGGTLTRMKQAFVRRGCEVADIDISGATKRSSGIAYREAVIVMADGQSVTIQIKQTGDIFAVKINNKGIPITSQDDQGKAIDEICGRLESGRKAFQKAQTREKVVLPPSVRSSVKQQIEIIRTECADLDKQIAKKESELNKLQGV